MATSSVKINRKLLFLCNFEFNCAADIFLSTLENCQLFVHILAFIIFVYFFSFCT